VGVVLFDILLLPFASILLILASAAFSGGLGGVLAYFILKQIYKLELLANEDNENNGDNDNEE
jgi:hypothetical protein